MPTVNVAGGSVELYYELHGEGPEKLLLVMGLGTSAIAWEPTVEWILQQSSDYQICIFDNRGVGRSSSPPGRYTTSMMAQDALELLAHLQWTDFHLVGVSMGGMISQELTLAALDRIRTLTLVVTHSGGKGSLPPASGVFLMMKSMRTKTPADRAPIVLEMMFSPKFLAESTLEEGKTNQEVLVQRYIDTANRLPPPNQQGYRSQVLAVNTHSVGNKRLQQIRDAKFPVMIVTGTADKLVNHKASLFLNETLKAEELVLFEGAGHGVMTEKFDEFNQAIMRHFKRSKSVSAPAMLVSPAAEMMASAKTIAPSESAPAADMQILADEEEIMAPSDDLTDIPGPVRDD